MEFEIVLSCYTLDIQEKLEQLSEVGFSKKERKEIARSLRKLTNQIIHPEKGLWRQDAEKLGELERRNRRILTSDINTVEKIFWLVEDAKRYGTLPFAGLARAGFIAIQMLKSFVSVNIFSKDDYDRFLSGVETVNRRMAQDITVLGKDDFLKKYGHLRPGSYDILSCRYDETPERYFDFNKQYRPISERHGFRLTQSQKTKIEKMLTRHGIISDPNTLLDFIRSAIELREFAKFTFTRNLSDILVLITDFGMKYGVERRDLAFSNIGILKEFYVAGGESKGTLLDSIQKGKEKFSETLNIVLPPLISKPEDVWAFQWPPSTPNYITQKQLIAPIATLDKGEVLVDKIVCILNADPGFDWLFSHSIAGLVTAWGGPNSHMAIRAGELGLPALIGAGEILYNKIIKGGHLHLDCSGKRVEVLP